MLNVFFLGVIAERLERGKIGDLNTLSALDGVLQVDGVVVGLIAPLVPCLERITHDTHKAALTPAEKFPFL